MEIWEAIDKFGRRHQIVKKNGKYLVKSYPLDTLVGRRETYGSFNSLKEAQKFLEIHDGIEISN